MFEFNQVLKVFLRVESAINLLELLIALYLHRGIDKLLDLGILKRASFGQLLIRVVLPAEEG